MNCEICGKEMCLSGVGWDKEEGRLYMSFWCGDCEILEVVYRQFHLPPPRLVPLMGE